MGLGFCPLPLSFFFVAVAGERVPTAVDVGFDQSPAGHGLHSSTCHAAHVAQRPHFLIVSFAASFLLFELKNRFPAKTKWIARGKKDGDGHEFVTCRPVARDCAGDLEVELAVGSVKTAHLNTNMRRGGMLWADKRIEEIRKVREKSPQRYNADLRKADSG